MNREIRERIVDYSDNQEEVEKWLRVKGEEKYRQFADMLDVVDCQVTWKNISNLYQYDKRLLINSFKYLSFFEEFARAVIIDNSDNPKSYYYKIQNEGMFGQLTEQLLKLDNEVLENYFDSTNLVKDIKVIRILRNAVAHNRIILSINDYRDVFYKFSRLIPKDFRGGYIKDINNCEKGLIVPENCVARL